MKAEVTKTSSEVDRKLELLNKLEVKSIKGFFFFFVTFHYPLNYIIHTRYAPYVIPNFLINVFRVSAKKKLACLARSFERINEEIID